MLTYYSKEVRERPAYNRSFFLDKNIGRTLSDKNLSKIFFDSPPRIVKIKTNKFKTIAEYQIKQKDTMITVCDYASAGKDWDRRDKKRITVWMD